MAAIEIEGRFPRCSGCGTVFHGFLPAGLDSRTRGEPFSEAYRRLGTIAPRLAAWAAAHASCPEPVRTVTAAGVVVVDRRSRRDSRDEE